MNAIVMGPKMNETEAGEEYELIDYHQGLKDFEAGIIRAVGNPSERFAEDALRMMRAVRFAAQLGFSIEPTTLKGLVEQAPLLKKISRERVRDELMKILGSDHPADGIQLLTNSGLMEFIIPELLAGRGVTQTGHHHSDVYTHLVESLRACPSSDPLVRLATLLHDIAKPATRKLRCFKCGWVMKENNLVHMGESAKLTQYKCPRCGGLQSEHQAATFYAHEVAGARMATEIGERLRLSRKEIDKLTTLVRWHMFSYDPTMTDAAIRRFIRRVGVENINDLILLRIGDRKGSGAQTTSWRLMELQKRVGEQLYQPMTTNDLAIDGNEIMKELNIKPGPLVGKILNALFEEVIEDTDKNNREYLMERTKKLVKEIEV